ncbi:ATP-binding cassette domain-containing protein [Phytohabitans sp. ZYX-F-186]|uniref:ATP-binding cassette domain-containing protein n=1 Tax=Phytohabitans maris TaxID=3071409 RepID=A0ABU0ZJD6_9ACTN|nr:ATP-binding cassette domain-containing protein [Phytohabitans sp. ZYX-F-186]MDQ7906067.1 ATP-binding cassette domain-containing protein [Phytohabitans sp. ZYX-F-186]
MITLAHVTVEYPDATPLQDVSLTLGSSTTAIVGPSGSGKSTLLRIIGGMQVPTSGAVSIDDVAVVTASWRSAGDPRVSLIHQDYRLVPFLTVEQNLLLAAEMRRVRRTSADVTSVLGKVALPASMRGRLPATLSGGQQQRVAIARSLIAGTSVILADEPTGALDVKNTERVTDILVDLGRQHGLAIVVATHDQSVAQKLDHRFELAEGRLVQLA